MNFAELLLLALLGWTVIGLLGVGWSAIRREREKVTRGLWWIVAVWALYLVVLVGFSLGQRQKVLAVGQAQCFGDMCFVVTGTETLPTYVGPNGTRDGSRLVRVKIRVTNKAKTPQSERAIREYLIDGQGRRWDELPGLTGIRLTTMVSAGQSVVSEPVFKLKPGVSGLRLVLTHGRWQLGALVIGDSDSVWHKKTVVDLGL